MIRLALILGVLVLGTLVLGNAAERWLIYPLDDTRVSPDAGLPGMQELVLESDGEELIVWSAAPAPGKPVILYFHGNAGNLALRAGRFGHFLQRGYGIYAPAYRGSSGSTGSPSEATLTLDAAAAYAAVLAHYGDMGQRGVVIYGESLGTAVALSLFDDPGADPAALILEAPFTSVPDMAEMHYPGSGALAAKFDNQWPSLKRAKQVDVPLLVLHGTNDELIPIEMGRQIYAAAPSREKSFLTVSGAGHTDLWRSDTLPRLWHFVDQFAFR